MANTTGGCVGSPSVATRPRIPTPPLAAGSCNRKNLDDNGYVPILFDIERVSDILPWPTLCRSSAWSAAMPATASGCAVCCGC